MAIERTTRTDIVADEVVVSQPVAYEQETVTVRDTDPLHAAARYASVRHVVYYILGAIEILLAARFILKMLGANTASSFVSFIYALSGAFLAPFVGIFRPAVTRGAETASIIEPATIIAMIVYALIAWGIVRTVRMFLEQKALARQV